MARNPRARSARLRSAVRTDAPRVAGRQGESGNERARSFRSVFMVASCAGAALGCYLVSLRVASERAALEGVETKIVLAQRDIRLLQTEIGTRGRLAQLERWNVKVLALSAPTADQFLEGGFPAGRPWSAPRRRRSTRGSGGPCLGAAPTRPQAGQRRRRRRARSGAHASSRLAR